MFRLRHSPTHRQPRIVRIAQILHRAEERAQRDRSIWSITLVGRLRARLDIELRAILQRQIEPSVAVAIFDDVAAIDAAVSFARIRLSRINRESDHLPSSVLRELSGVQAAIAQIENLAQRADCRLNKARYGNCSAYHTHDSEMEIPPLAFGA